MEQTSPLRSSTRPRLASLKGLGPLPEDCVRAVLPFLSPVDLLRLCSADRSHTLGSGCGSMALEWRDRCVALWCGKVCVTVHQPPSSDANGGGTPQTAIRDYFGAIRDSKRVTFHSAAELCAQHFHFRFKVGAGEYWHGRNHAGQSEPYAPMYRRFLMDGRMCSQPPAHSAEGDGGEHEKYLAYTVAPMVSFLSRLPQDDQIDPQRFSKFDASYIYHAHGWWSQLDPLESDPELSEIAMKIRWRFTATKGGRRGQFIMLNR